MSTEALQDAIRNLHGCESIWVEAVHVTETFQSELVWDGDVQVFILVTDQEADMAYAWTEPVEGSENRRFFVVLNEPPVDSPEAAVQASIAARYRGAV